MHRLLRLKNYTDIPDEKIRGTIAFVKPRNLPTSKFDVRVTKTTGIYKGVCYSDGFQDPNRPHIIVRITKNENLFPYLDTTPSTPTKRVDTYYNKLNDKTGKLERWRHREFIPNPNGGVRDTSIPSYFQGQRH